MSSPQLDESDDWNGLSDHEDAGSSSSESAHAFLDIEAFEADSDHQQSDDSIEDDDDLPSFPQFMELPAELREMVWKAFCPDLDGQPRVFEIVVTSNDASAELTVRTPGQATSIRTMMAVHRESREYALKVSPSKIEFPDEQAIVPCDFENDIVLMSFTPLDEISERALILINDCLSRFRNIALQMEAVEHHSWFPSFLNLFENLKNVYIVEEEQEQGDKALGWCVSGKICEYSFAVKEDLPIPAAPVETTYIWPDVIKHRDFAHREFPPIDIHDFEGSASDVVEDGSDAETQRDDAPGPVSFHYMMREWSYTIMRYRQMMADHFGAQIASLENGDNEETLGVWPMAVFTFASGHQRLADLKSRQNQPWVDWPSSPEVSDRGGTPDDYESDGIDDDAIDDHLSSDEDDDIPAHLLAGSDIDESDDMRVDTSDLDALEAAQFSSDSDADSSRSDDEYSSHDHTAPADPQVIQLDSESESSNEPDAVAPLRRHRLHIIDDSEDEDSEGEAPLAPARGVKRRARAILLDSEDEEDQDNESPDPSRAAKRRARPAISSDSEDEEEDDGDTKTGKTPGSVPTATDDGPTEDDEDDEESSSDDDNEPPPAKRMSLAQRLQIEYRSSRAARPTDDSDDEAADGRSYSGASDDDEGDEDGSEGGGLVLGMAEEGEEDEEEDDMDGW